MYLLEGILQTIKLIYTIQLNKPSFSRRQTSLLLQCPHLSTIKTNYVNYDFIMKRIHYPAGWLVKLFYFIKFIQLSPLWFQIKNPKPKTKLLLINYWKKFHWSLLMRFKWDSNSKMSNIFPLPQRRPLFLPAPGWLARSALPAVAVWCHLQWCSKILEGLAKASLLEL